MFCIDENEHKTRDEVLNDLFQVAAFANREGFILGSLMVSKRVFELFKDTDGMIGSHYGAFKLIEFNLLQEI